MVALAGFLPMFFFLTLYMQTVLHYSPIQTRVAYLPLTGGFITAPRRRLVLRHAATGSATVAGGAFRPARTPPSIGIVVPVIQRARSLA